MKLRFQSHSIRLRLKQAEVEQFTVIHRVEETIAMGPAISDTFQYVLEAKPDIAKTSVTLMNRGLTVHVPLETALRWARGSDVGIDVTMPSGHGAESSLQILIEKDFACLHGGTEDDNADTFPNPLAATVGKSA